MDNKSSSSILPWLSFRLGSLLLLTMAPIFFYSFRTSAQHIGSLCFVLFLLLFQFDYNIIARTGMVYRKRAGKKNNDPCAIQLYVSSRVNAPDEGRYANSSEASLSLAGSLPLGRFKMDMERCESTFQLSFPHLASSSPC